MHVTAKFAVKTFLMRECSTTLSELLIFIKICQVLHKFSPTPAADLHDHEGEFFFNLPTSPRPRP